MSENEDASINSAMHKYENENKRLLQEINRLQTTNTANQAKLIEKEKVRAALIKKIKSLDAALKFERIATEGLQKKFAGSDLVLKDLQLEKNTFLEKEERSREKIAELESSLNADRIKLLQSLHENEKLQRNIDDLKKSNFEYRDDAIDAGNGLLKKIQTVETLLAKNDLLEKMMKAQTEETASLMTEVYELKVRLHSLTERNDAKDAMLSKNNTTRRALETEIHRLRTELLSLSKRQSDKTRVLFGGAAKCVGFARAASRAGGGAGKTNKPQPTTTTTEGSVADASLYRLNRSPLHGVLMHSAVSISSNVRASNREPSRTSSDTLLRASISSPPENSILVPGGELSLFEDDRSSLLSRSLFESGLLLSFPLSPVVLPAVPVSPSGGGLNGLTVPGEAIEIGSSSINFFPSRPDTGVGVPAGGTIGTADYLPQRIFSAQLRASSGQRQNLARPGSGLVPPGLGSAPPGSGSGRVSVMSRRSPPNSRGASRGGGGGNNDNNKTTTSGVVNVPHVGDIPRVMDASFVSKRASPLRPERLLLRSAGAVATGAGGLEMFEVGVGQEGIPSSSSSIRPASASLPFSLPPLVLLNDNNNNSVKLNATSNSSNNPTPVSRGVAEQQQHRTGDHGVLSSAVSSGVVGAGPKSPSSSADPQQQPAMQSEPSSKQQQQDTTVLNVSSLIRQQQAESSRKLSSPLSKSLFIGQGLGFRSASPEDKELRSVSRGSARHKLKTIMDSFY